LQVRIALPLLMLLVLVAGCGGDHATADEHDHAHGEPVLLQETAWNETHEVYVEYEPLVMKQIGSLLVQVTDLRTGRQVPEGVVRVEWQDPEGATVADTVAAPDHPGAWRVPVTLPTAGFWALAITVPGTSEPLNIPVVRVYVDSHVAMHAEFTEPEGAIHLLKEQQWRLGVRSEPARHETFVHQLRVAATVEAPPDRRVVVTTPVAGRLAPTGDVSMARLGERVKLGQPVGVIRAPLSGDASDLAAAESALVRTRQDLHLAEAELERAESLVAVNAAPARRVEEAEAQVAAAQAGYDAARRLIAGDGEAPELLLRAPIDGTVVAVASGAGEFIDSGGPVLTILDPSTVWIRGWIPEGTLADLPALPLATIDVPGDPEESGGSAGRPLFLSPELDPASRTVAVVYELDNASGRLRVGQALGLRLETSRRADEVLVPMSALVDEHGYPVVFVQTAGETFVKRNVTLGGNDGLRAVVHTGVLPGERVVSEAAWAVKLAAAGTSAPAHGHTH